MKMRTFRPALGLLVLALTATTACEDPSNVGLGLVGGEGGDPEVLSFETVFLEHVEQAGILDGSTRALAGSVDDPLTGPVTARGYIDFSAANLADNFQSGTVSAVALNLVPDYLYGDTTTAVTLALYDVADEWSGDIVEEADLPPLGEKITEFTFLPSDTLITLDLPEAWVTTYDPILRSDDFAADFHGFMLEQVAGNAVIGFAEQSTYLAPVVGTDTVSLLFTKDISAMTRGDVPATFPTDRVLVQNGPGPALSFDFDFSDTDAAALNRAVFRFYVDTLAVEPPAGFLRPMATNLNLVGIRSDTVSTLLTITTMNEEGWFDFDAALLQSNLEAVFNGTIEPFERFEIQAQPLSGTTINPLILYGRSAPEKAPQAHLTLTRLQ